MTGTASGQAPAAQAVAWCSVLVPRAAAWYSALPPRRRELAQDTALALGLALLNLLTLVPYHAQIHPAWLAFVLVAGQCLPLAGRRVGPVPALILCGGIRTCYDVLGFGYAPVPLAVAIAFATVADRSRPWLRWCSLAGMAAGLTYSQTLPGHNQPYDAIIQVFIVAAAWAIGMLSRNQRGVIAAASQRAEQAEAELDAAAARAAAAERLRIARELHDVVAHHVSLMAVQAEAVGALLPERVPQAAQSADVIAQTGRQALAELRRLLGVLRSAADHSAADSAADHRAADRRERPALAPPASLSSLEDVLSQVRDAGLPVSLSVSGEPATLAPGIDLTAYRIVQEALTNTIRHAPGARASVQIRYADSSVTIDVRDTGAAAAPSTSAPSAPSAPASRAAARAGGRPDLPPGFGLAGIAERVASCGGTLTLGPLPQAGFAVTARLPVR